MCGTLCIGVLMKGNMATTEAALAHVVYLWEMLLWKTGVVICCCFCLDVGLYWEILGTSKKEK